MNFHSPKHWLWNFYQWKWKTWISILKNISIKMAKSWRTHYFQRNWYVILLIWIKRKKKSEVDTKFQLGYLKMWKRLAKQVDFDITNDKQIYTMLKQIDDWAVQYIFDNSAKILKKVMSKGYQRELSTSIKFVWRHHSSENKDKYRWS